MYLVTGGAGFIGSCLLATLNAAGIEDILVVDNLGSGEKWRNLESKRFSDYIHKDELRLRLEEDRMPRGIRAVLHMGACSSTTETDAEYMLRNNYRYSRLLAEWALKKGVRMIYASSAATYGNGDLGFSDEDSGCEQLRPLNIYGYSKQLFDLWALRSGAAQKLAGLKFFNVYGPNEYHKGNMQSVVVKAFEQINSSGSVKLFKSYRSEYADGEQLRDFIYVKDCCDVMWWLLQTPQVNGIYNLGTGKARSWNDLVCAVFSALGRRPAIDYIEMDESLRPRYQYFTEAKMEKLRNAGYTKPFTSLEDGVSDYVTHYLSSRRRL
jgi:ADP-L-glycero-D-manno-heptose 6-epimerase